ncbi:gliding motility-associated C-terminal domain-containing protein [Paraflavisolibacter sp. H34]|uniref:T9SS type B sorting domain-containing protein n=1 Tax=Huijunlia imazamoxiresistens TaxID=3127457 RepID=UPI003016FB66
MRTYLISLWAGVFFLLAGGSLRSQTSTSSLFVKSYTLESAPENKDFLLALPGGSTIFGGRGHSNASITKADAQGNIVWNKKIPLSALGPSTQAVLAPGGVLWFALGGGSFARMDTTGRLLSAKKVIHPEGDCSYIDMQVAANGDLCVLFRDWTGSGGDKYLLTRFDPGFSQIRWTAFFSADFANYRQILVDGDRVLVAGSSTVSSREPLAGNLLCFNATTGKPERQVTLELDGHPTDIRNIYSYDNGYLVTGIYLPQGNTIPENKAVAVRLDKALQPRSAFRLRNQNGPDFAHLWVEPDGSFFGVSPSVGNTYFHVSPTDSLLWSRITMTQPAVPCRIVRSGGQLVVASEYHNFLSRSDLNALVGDCPWGEEANGTIPLRPTLISGQIYMADTSLLTVSPLSLTLQNHPAATAFTYCSSTSSCASLSIQGASLLCTARDRVLFTGKRNAGCSLPVDWQLTGGRYEAYRLNDSTFSVRFLQNGTYRLTARLGGSSVPIADSLEVTYHAPDGLSLGPDTTLCTGGSLTLQAGQGYRGYLWQDGSTGTSFTVRQPGTYHVRVETACGSFLRDTITVGQAPPPPFDLGGNRSVCNDDTLVVTAPGGFTGYNWQPAAAVRRNGEQTVTLTPPVSTQYRVTATGAGGCIATGTLLVRVYHSTPLDLGKDTSFCAGGSVTLRAGDGFVRYLWNDGSTQATLPVPQKGLYRLKAWNANGCLSEDSLRVREVYPNPKVRLSGDSVLCAGTAQTLDAGSGFAAYQWNTGSREQVITVRDKGVYRVDVWDGNGCRGSDSTAVTRIQERPAGFLPEDTALCAGTVLRLTSLASFSSYRWSTGAPTPGITISQPGTYRLEVTDASGCTGTDTIQVRSKLCVQEPSVPTASVPTAYAPTAFTPNSDGKNDSFRPLLLGKVVKYQLVVLNRWGTKLFETTDPAKGWDGTCKGRQEAFGTYGWFCTYQLEGKPAVQQRGTIVLLR